MILDLQWVLHKRQLYRKSSSVTPKKILILKGSMFEILLQLGQARNSCQSHLLFGEKQFSSPFSLRSSIRAKRIYFENWQKWKWETVAGHLNWKCTIPWDVWHWHKENGCFLKRCSVKPKDIKNICWRRQKSTWAGESMLTTSAEELKLWLLHFKILKGRVIEQVKHSGHVKQNQCMCKQSTCTAPKIPPSEHDKW